MADNYISQIYDAVGIENIDIEFDNDEIELKEFS